MTLLQRATCVILGSLPLRNLSQHSEKVGCSSPSIPNWSFIPNYRKYLITHSNKCCKHQNTVAREGCATFSLFSSLWKLLSCPKDRAFQNSMFPSENVEMNQLGISRTNFVSFCFSQKSLSCLTQHHKAELLGKRSIYWGKENNCKVLPCGSSS